jgi:hypothetical protein
MAPIDDIVMLCINIASAILSFVAVLSIVTKNFEAGVAVGVLVMISQLIAAVKSFMESSSAVRAQQDTNRILNEILTEMRGMQDMMHGQYHSSNIQPGTLTSNAQSTGFDLPSEVRKDVVSHPNETEAIVRDLIDDMLTAVVDGTPLVQMTPSWTERKTAENVEGHESACDLDLDARDAELAVVREPKKTV